jgi:hypothetical protein
MQKPGWRTSARSHTPSLAWRSTTRPADSFCRLWPGARRGSVAASPQVWLGERGRPLTAEEIEFNMEISRQYAMIAERDLKALQARVEAALVDAAGAEHTDGTLATVYANKSLGGLNTIKEPNDWAHRNYCGPGSISVALDAIWSLSSIPNMDTIANTIRTYPGGWTVNGVFYSHFDPAVGTSGTGLCKYLHDYFKNNFTERYLLQPISISPTDNQDFWQKIGIHVDRNYALVTGTQLDFIHLCGERKGVGQACEKCLWNLYKVGVGG